MTTKIEHSASQLSAAANIKNIWGNIVYNVKASPYLAKGDGVTDDSAAIQAAINAANAAGGGTVYFPPYTYYIGTILSLYSNVTLSGVHGKSKLIKPSTLGYVLKSQSISNVIIEDLIIDGGTPVANPDLSDEQKHNIVFSNATNCFVIRCTSQNAGGDGIYLGSVSLVPSDNVIIKDCIINQVGRNGVSLVGASYCKVMGSRISGANGPILGVGLDIEPNVGDICIGNEVIGNVFTNCLYGFTTTPNNSGNDRTMHGNVFRGNISYECEIGGQCSGDLAHYSENLFISNESVGLNISGATNSTFKNNTVIDNGTVTTTNGQVNILNSTNIDFDGNRIMVSDTTSTNGNAYNLSLTAACTNVAIRNNDYGVIKSGGSAVTNTGTGERYFSNNVESATDGPTHKSIMYMLIADIAKTFLYDMNFYKGNGIGNFAFRRGTPSSYTDVWTCTNSGVTNQIGAFKILGTQILTSQQPAIANTSGAALAAVEAEVNKLKAMLRAHGLIVT